MIQPEKESVPYIGITSITTLREAERIKLLYSKYLTKGKSNHIGMFGYSVNSSILFGKESGYKRYVSLKQLIPVIELTSGSGLNVLHYLSDADRLPHLVSDLTALLKYASINNGHLCETVQINNGLVNIHNLIELKHRFPSLSIILPIQRHVIQNTSVSEIAEMVKEYSYFVDYFLIDPSAGTGQSTDINLLISILKSLKHHYVQLGIGVTGGFTPDNTEYRVKQVVNEVGTYFSIDAESGLRDQLSKDKWNDVLNLDKAAKYIQAAAIGFGI